jgi:peptide/nickel transport system substrate-binding protein
MTSTRKWRAAAAALLTIATLGAGQLSASPSGGDLRYATAQFPVSLDVQTFPAEEGVQTAASQVLETLVTYSEGEAAPLLAESWDNPDPLTWTFTLREGVTFSDGTPLTATDVKASLDRLIALEGPLTPLFTAVTETRADDDTTFTIVTSEPLGTMLSSLSLVFIGKADGVESEEYWLSPIGTGPFVVEEYVADDHVTLARNDSYWGELVLLDTVTIVNLPEVAARITALETGEIDVLTGIPPDQLGGVEGIDGVELLVEDSYQYYFIWFNQDHEPFADVRVRQAMWHAVDVAGLVGDLFGDGATVAAAPITQSVFGAPTLEQYAYDPDLARELLTEAGFPDGFSTTIHWAREGGPNIRSLAQAMVSAWAEVGIEVEMLEKERAQWLEDFGAGEWDLNLQTNTTGTGDADFTLNRLYNCVADRMGYCNEELDAILNQARASLDPEERIDLYAQASQIIWDDAVGIFPADLRINAAYRSDVVGFVLPTNNRPSFATVSLEG